jgi:hypothetical protein
MKTIIKLFIILLIPARLFAQDTLILKVQANKLIEATLKKDYNTLASFTYPKVVEMMGGKEKMIQTIQTGMQKLSDQGFTVQKGVIGSPGKFYKAGKEIHCLLPETITMLTKEGKLLSKSNLLAITQDGGSNWYFLDVNSSTINFVPKLFPQFNKKLVLPEPAEPELIDN